MPVDRLSRLLAGCAIASLAVTGCAGSGSGPQLPPASFVAMQEGPGEDYVIGPLDELTIFVWRNPELGQYGQTQKQRHHFVRQLTLSLSKMAVQCGS